VSTPKWYILLIPWPGEIWQLHNKLVAGQCNIARNVVTSWNAWNPVVRNGGSIYTMARRDLPDTYALA